MAGTETIVVTVNTNVGGVVKSGANQLALIGELDVGATVAANEVNLYTRAADATADHGSGSVLATGVAAALSAGLARVFAVGYDDTTGSPFSEVFGDASAIDTATLTNTPVASITSASLDGVAYATDKILFTTADPTTLSPAADEIYFNMKTGVFQAGASSSGASNGFEITYVVFDLDSVFDKLGLESYEYITFAGVPLSAESYGLYDALLTHATTENKVIATAYDSGVTPADVETLTTAVADGRMKVCAAYYTGDFVSAFAAGETKRAVNGTSKEQVAPSGITFTDSYVRSEFGDEEAPASGTFHNFGANAIFKDKGGTYRISNDRSTASLTDFEKFHSTRRSIRFVENEIAEDLLATRRNSSTSIPYTESGLAVIRGSILSTLARMRSKGIIDKSIVEIPALGDISDADRLNRIVPDVDVFVRLAGQVHLVKITLSVEV